MGTLTLSLLETTEVCTTFTKRFFDLHKIARQATTRRGDSSPSLHKLVQPLMSHIAKGEISKCEPDAFTQLIGEACQIVRSATPSDESGQGTSVLPVNLLDCCIWLCSLCAVGPSSKIARMEVIGMWVSLNLSVASQAELEQPTELLESIIKSLLPLHQPELDIVERVQLEFVIHASRELSFNKPFPAIALSQAKEWCNEMVALPDISDSLKHAAKILNVSLPAPPEQPQSSTESTVKKEFTPIIFRLPKRVPPGSFQEQLEHCLTVLLGIPIDEVLSAATAQRISKLSPDTELVTAAGAMHFIAFDIWQTFWKSGDMQALEAASEFAEFAYMVNTKVGDQRHRGIELQLFLTLQLPEIIRSSSLGPIRKEAPQLFRSEGCPYYVAGMLSGIVQAVAGACRVAENAKDEDDRDSLLMMFGEELQQIHKDHESGTRGRYTDETEAWKYIAPLIDINSSPKYGGVPVDSNLARLVNRANHHDVFSYISSQLEQTRNALERKLTNHRLSGDHLMRPSGRLINPQGQVRGMLLPAFENGLRLLDDGEFDRAAAEFEELASNRKLNVVQQSISRDYQAYAYARKDKFIAAKPLLRTLRESNYRFPSAYWNLACIETEREDQVSALSFGLDRAPHPNMLEAVVYLSTASC